MVVSENDDTAVGWWMKNCRRVAAAGVENAMDWRLLSRRRRRRSVVVSAEIMVVVQAHTPSLVVLSLGCVGVIVIKKMMSVRLSVCLSVCLSVRPSISKVLLRQIADAKRSKKLTPTRTQYSGTPLAPNILARHSHPIF